MINLLVFYKRDTEELSTTRSIKHYQKVMQTLCLERILYNLSPGKGSFLSKLQSLSMTKISRVFVQIPVRVYPWCCMSLKYCRSEVRAWVHHRSADRRLAILAVSYPMSVERSSSKSKNDQLVIDLMRHCDLVKMHVGAPIQNREVAAS